MASREYQRDMIVYYNSEHKREGSPIRRLDRSITGYLIDEDNKYNQAAHYEMAIEFKHAKWQVYCEKAFCVLTHEQLIKLLATTGDFDECVMHKVIVPIGALVTECDLCNTDVTYVDEIIVLCTMPVCIPLVKDKSKL